MFENASLPPKKHLKKTIRGTYGYIFSKYVVKVKLNDNTSVTVATNNVKAAPCVKTERCNTFYVTLVQPFQTYNKRILVVDLFDLFVVIIWIRNHSEQL